MNIRYRVDLMAEERDELGRLLSAGKCAARRLKRAQILFWPPPTALAIREVERTIGARRRSFLRSAKSVTPRTGLSARISLCTA